MRKIMLLVIFGMGISSFVLAQSITPSVIAANGGSASTETMVIDWTLGETAITSSYADELFYTQGFHQPILRVKEIPVKPEQEYLIPANEEIEISLSPNPVTSSLQLKLQSLAKQGLDIQISDISGKRVLNEKLLPLATEMQIDMEAFPSGIYILNVYDPDRSLIGSYKITKLQ